MRQSARDCKRSIDALDDSVVCKKVQICVCVLYIEAIRVHETAVGQVKLCVVSKPQHWKHSDQGCVG